MDNQERIADALEEKNEIIMGILYGILASFLIILGFILVMVFGQTVYDFFVYELLDNDRPPTPTYAVAQPEPLDDCNYSDDKQLCYQMKRIADSMESDLIIEQGSMIVDPVSDTTVWTLVDKETYFETNDKFHRTTIHNNFKYYYLGEEK